MTGEDNKSGKTSSIAAAMSNMQAALGGAAAASQSTATQAAGSDHKAGLGTDLRRIIKEVSQEARKSRVPLYIAVLAACLALVSMAEGDAKERALGAHIETSNQFSYFQAKNIRQTDSEIAAEMLEGIGKPQLAAAWRTRANRYENEKRDILKEARAQQAIRAHGLKQSSYFAIAIALLQIGIVLATAALILGGGFLLWASVGFALIAMFFTFNGYYLYIEFPTDPVEFGKWIKTHADEAGWLRRRAN